MEQHLLDVSGWGENTQIPPFTVCSSYKLAKFSLHSTARLMGAKIPASPEPPAADQLFWSMCCWHALPPSLGSAEAPSFLEHSWLFLLTIWSQVNAFPTTQNLSLWHQDFFFHVLSAGSSFLFLTSPAKSLCGDICRSFSTSVFSWNEPHPPVGGRLNSWNSWELLYKTNTG